MAVGKVDCGPEETECPNACCPVANFFCCPDGRYCAETPDKCPPSKSDSFKELSDSFKEFSVLVKKSACHQNETECPGGCCQLANAYCCPDDIHCARGPDKCPQSKSDSLKELSAGKVSCGPEETECPNACCPVANFLCCPDGRYCAETPDKCPPSKSDSSKELSDSFKELSDSFKELSVAKITCDPDETECPGGCCSEANWFCCPDGRYCAATAEDCQIARG